SITAGSSVVTLKPFTGQQLISLGGTDANGTLGLTDGELDQVSAAVLRIGSPACGNIAVTNSVEAEAQYGTLTLISGGGVTEVDGAILSVPSLRVSAASAVLLTDINLIGSVAAAVTNAGQAFALLSQGNLVVGTV